MTAPSPAHAGLIAALEEAIYLLRKIKYNTHYQIDPEDTPEAECLIPRLKLGLAALVSEGEPQPVAEWQDIANAPRDGTLLILACSDWPHVMTGKPVPVKIGGWDVPMARWHIFGASWAPTHWQPAPLFAASPHPTEEAGNG